MTANERKLLSAFVATLLVSVSAINIFLVADALQGMRSGKAALEQTKVSAAELDARIQELEARMAAMTPGDAAPPQPASITEIGEKTRKLFEDCNLSILRMDMQSTKTSKLVQYTFQGSATNIIKALRLIAASDMGFAIPSFSIRRLEGKRIFEGQLSVGY